VSWKLQPKKAVRERGLALPQGWHARLRACHCRRKHGQERRAPCVREDHRLLVWDAPDHAIYMRDPDSAFLRGRSRTALRERREIHISLLGLDMTLLDGRLTYQPGGAKCLKLGRPISSF
jgi:hypothetical protein